MSSLLQPTVALGLNSEGNRAISTICLTFGLYSSGSQSVVHRCVPKTLTESLQGQNYFCINDKTLFAFFTMFFCTDNAKPMLG